MYFLSFEIITNHLDANSSVKTPPISSFFSHQSGATQQDMIANAKATSEALHQKKFNLDHAWVLLRHQPKWLQVVESLKKNSISKTLVGIEEENIYTEKRPLGNKAAKRKMKEAAKNDSIPISVQIQKLHEEKKERDERKMELIKKKVKHDEQKKFDLSDLIFWLRHCLWTQVRWVTRNDYIIPNLK
ncbi:uncharacterized protein LOC126622710 [Malus sylvestris]|uniref:uncharacterized protein LOC126622710 n=1 Tax=Malus sylvestris TaxID=3752 RepID=UPI0021AC594C|nr:uncharacterized protein LOC126622710 [Malus sylvestris]